MAAISCSARTAGGGCPTSVSNFRERGADMVLQYDVQDHIATVTLDRPDVKNALNRELYGRLEQAFRDAHRDADVRCVIVTGAGSAFCSGDDVREIMLAEMAAVAVPRPRRTRRER